jgi:hypothetical protein
MSTPVVMFLSFAALGLLIGSIAGLTSAAITTSLLSALFAFVGGSVLAFLPKFNNEDRRVASSAIAGLSMAATIGLYGSLYVREHRVLSSSDGGAGGGYLRSQETGLNQFLIQQLQTGEISLDDACARKEPRADSGHVC